MNDITRRDFLALSTKIAAALGLGASSLPSIADALTTMSKGQAPVLWLQGQSCSGCSVSLLNSEAPTPVELLTSYISLRFHSTLSAATGEVAVQAINEGIKKGGNILVLEGAIPAGMPHACVVGGETLVDQLLRAAKSSTAAIALGTCAAFGGIPAAENNPTGSVSLPEFFKQNRITLPTIVLPGCPSHPDWLVATIVHVLKFGIPQLDKKGRPTAFFKTCLHDQCTRFPDYERERFAKTFADEGCFFKLGCAGPITKADCPLRQWNGGVNYCIKAGAPCIGCASENFAAKQSFPLITKANAKQHTKGKA